MFTFSILVILAVAYVILKTLNVRAEFARRDAERAREEQAAMEAMEEAEEEAEIRASAIDVDAETIDNDEPDDEVFEVEPAEEKPEEAAAIDVPEYEKVN